MLAMIDPGDPLAAFPPVDQALEDPSGLLAIGGDLSTARLLRAYRRGIFPWYSAGEPILWWSPDPRAVLYPGGLRVTRSLRQSLRNRGYRVTADRAFSPVVDACAAPRGEQRGTWITSEMRNAYARLHALGHAHSIETWSETGELVGGLYGVMLGRVFFGESMFARARDASKVALVKLIERLTPFGLALVDCQVASTHVMSLGAELVPRADFTASLEVYADLPLHDGAW